MDVESTRSGALAKVATRSTRREQIILGQVLGGFDRHWAE